MARAKSAKKKPAMGRPRLKASEKKNSTIAFRVPDDYIERLEQVRLKESEERGVQLKGSAWARFIVEHFLDSKGY